MGSYQLNLYSFLISIGDKRSCFTVILPLLTLFEMRKVGAEEGATEAEVAVALGRVRG